MFLKKENRRKIEKNLNIRQKFTEIYLKLLTILLLIQ